MINFSKLAEQLSQKSGHSFFEWHSTINAVLHDPAFSQMTDGEIHELIAAVRSPNQLHWILDYFRDEYTKLPSGLPFDFLMGYVQRSGFSLRSWFAVMTYVKANGHRLNVNEGMPELLSFIEELAKQCKAESQTDLLKFVREKIG